MESDIYYNNNLKFLYEGKDSMYNIDQLLFSYTKQTFNDVMGIQKLFNVISRNDIRGQSYNEVNIRMVQKYRTNMNQLSFINNFNDNIPEIFLDMSRSNNRYSFNEINNNVLKNISNNNISNPTYTTMDDYMRIILRELCFYFFNESLKNMSLDLKQRPSNDLRDAFSTVKNVLPNSITRMNTLYDYLLELGLSVLLKILNDSENTITTNIMSDFTTEFDIGFKGPIYYMMRTRMIDEFISKPGLLASTNDASISFIKKLLVDSFIKTGCVLIHFIFVDAMMKQYSNKGDYVNIRIALLAKIYIVNNTINSIKNSYPSSETNNTDLVTISNNLYIYLNKINSDADIPGVIKKIHTSATESTNAGKTVVEMQKSVNANQQALRNVIVNNENVRILHRNKKIEFNIILTILVCLMIMYILAILLGATNVLFYVSMIVILIVLFIYVVKIGRAYTVHVS